MCVRERGGGGHSRVSYFNHDFCVCVCVCERERGGGHSGVSHLNSDLCVCVFERESQWSHLNRSLYVCVCVRERARRVYSVTEIVLIAACVQTHTSIITVSVTRLLPSRA